MKVKKLHTVQLEVIPAPVYDKTNILGYDLIPLMFANIFVCGRKGSGKTTVVFNLLKNCTDKDTKVIIFANTINSDSNWIFIKEWLGKHKYTAECYSSIMDGKINLLDQIMHELQEADRKEQEQIALIKEEKDHPKIEIVKFDSNRNSIKIKVKKKKKVAPKYFFIFDDISNELKDKEVTLLLKNLRHYKSKTILSS